MTDMPIDPRKLRADAEYGVPDEIGYVEGWRAWGTPSRLPRYGVGPKLYSVTHRDARTRRMYYWAPRQRAMAECDRCGEGVPGEHCACGFYSAKTLPRLMAMHYHLYDADRNGMVHIVGRVANWGKVVEGSHGWRARFSYPLELLIPFEAYEVGEGLAETYGVPVKLKNMLKPARAIRFQ